VHKPNFTLIPLATPKLLGQKSQNFSLDQILSLGQTYLAEQFFVSSSIFYWNFNKYWYVFENCVALL